MRRASPTTRAGRRCSGSFHRPGPAGYRQAVTLEDCTDGTPCYVARVTELPGCESHGITPDEALDNLEDAKRLYIESMIEDGIEPAPALAAAAHAG